MSKKIGALCDSYVEYIYEDQKKKISDIPEINCLPISILPIKVADGWVARLQDTESNHKEDVFVCHAQAGYILEEHTHLQHEIIEVLEGDVSVWINGEKTLVKSGENIEIASYQPHAACAENINAVLRVTFIPPITQNNQSHAKT